MQRYKLGSELRSFSELYFVIKHCYFFFIFFSFLVYGKCQSFRPEIIAIDDFKSAFKYVAVQKAETEKTEPAKESDKKPTEKKSAEEKK